MFQREFVMICAAPRVFGTEHAPVRPRLNRTMLLGTNEFAGAMRNNYAGCEERKALLIEWTRWSDVYTGNLKILNKTWTKLRAQAESAVLKNAERALKKCQELQAHFQRHLAEHGC